MKKPKKHVEHTPTRGERLTKTKYNQRYWKRKAEQMQQNADQAKEPSK